MLKYILKRIFYSLITISVVITITFTLIHTIPGGPFDSERNLPGNIKSNLDAKFGLDKSLSEQYIIYIRNALHGDLGPSIIYDGKTVNDIIKTSFPISAKIGLLAICFATVSGILIGVNAAVNKDKWQDKLCLIISTFSISTPNFILATILIYVFAIKLKYLPVVGLDTITSYILPVLALSSHPLAFIAKLIRSSLLETLQKDYIKATRAKGIPYNKIIYKYALKNALIPSITYIGSMIASILMGSFVIENIFGISGLGQEFVQSIYNRDYTVILGITIFYSTIFILFTLILDIVYVLIDPRIKFR